MTTLRNIVLGTMFAMGLTGAPGCNNNPEYLLLKEKMGFVEGFPVKYNGMPNDSTVSVTGASGRGIVTETSSNGYMFFKGIRYEITKATPESLIVKYDSTPK